MEDRDWLVRIMLNNIESKHTNIKRIANELGKSDRTIQSKIKSLGYKWDAKLSRYNYVGNETEPSEVDFRTLFDNKYNASKKIAKSNVNKSKQIAKTEIVNGEREVSAATIASNKVAKGNQNDINKPLVNNDNASEYDMIDMLLDSKPKAKKVYKGYYIDEDVASIIDSVDKKKKSELVNQSLRKVFKEKGLL